MKSLHNTLSARNAWIVSMAFAGFLIHPDISWGQGLYNQSRIYLNGVSIYVDGDITNSGLLMNEGMIGFTGNWESKGDYTGKGVLEVYGNVPQKIAHHDQKVYSLVINGWGTKYIKGKINITDEFHLKHGVVEVSEKDALRLKEEAVIFGGSPESYVDGALGVEGTGYKFFPVGKNGNYAPIEFVDVKGDEAKYSMEVFENAPIVSVDNVIVRHALYWQREDLDGQFGGSAIAVDFEPSYFQDPGNIILLAGTDWEKPFISLTDLDHSAETSKLTTRVNISAPIILLGEISERWTEADFYLSTALTPHAMQAENRKVKVFGERLAEEEFHFQVFNRQGAMVFESTSLENMATNGWDGRTLRGDELVSGAYPYRLTAFDKTGKKFEKKGVITIVY